MNLAGKVAPFSCNTVSQIAQLLMQHLSVYAGARYPAMCHVLSVTGC